MLLRRVKNAITPWADSEGSGCVDVFRASGRTGSFGCRRGSLRADDRYGKVVRRGLLPSIGERVLLHFFLPCAAMEGGGRKHTEVSNPCC